MFQVVQYLAWTCDMEATENNVYISINHKVLLEHIKTPKFGVYRFFFVVLSSTVDQLVLQNSKNSRTSSGSTSGSSARAPAHLQPPDRAVSLGTLWTMWPVTLTSGSDSVSGSSGL